MSRITKQPTVNMDRVDTKKIDVLDQGYVQLVDVMPGISWEDELPEMAIVDAARVSYQKGTKRSKKDKNLLRYLWEHQHTSPFEQVIFKFEIKAPLFVVQQMLRHRTARLNQESARYSVIKPEFYIPETLRAQGIGKNKQGSGEPINPWIGKYQNEALDVYRHHCEETFDIYQELLDSGVAREHARMVLPHSTYTSMVWQMDLSNLLHFIALRSDEHAQKEIQDYSNAMGTFVEILCPTVWSVFKEDADEQENS